MAKAVASLDVFDSPSLAQWLAEANSCGPEYPTEDGLDMSGREPDKFNKVLESARWKLLMTWLSAVRLHSISHFSWPPGESHILSLK